MKQNNVPVIDKFANVTNQTTMRHNAISDASYIRFIQDYVYQSRGTKVLEIGFDDPSELIVEIIDDSGEIYKLDQLMLKNLYRNEAML